MDTTSAPLAAASTTDDVFPVAPAKSADHLEYLEERAELLGTDSSKSALAELTTEAGRNGGQQSGAQFFCTRCCACFHVGSTCYGHPSDEL